MGNKTPPRLSQAKTAANSFLDYLRSTDESGLVSFSWTAKLTKALSNDNQATKIAINGLTAGGATNIGDAINLANQALVAAGQNPDTLKAEILLTDGVANQPNGNGVNENPQDIALAVSKSLEAAQAGIKMFVIGLGTGVNETMLRNLAATTGGNYYFAPTTADLNGIFDQIAYDSCGTQPTTLNVIIFNQKAATVSAGSVTISWYPNIPPTTRVVYGTAPVTTLGDAPNYGYEFSTLEQDSGNKTIYHTVTLIGLIPDVTYYWRPISAGSLEVVGDEMFFMTSAAGQETGTETSGSESGNASTSGDT